MKQTFKNIFFLHFEWIALATGLFLMALLDPLSSASSLCPIDRLGFDFCPGEGLGKSIAYCFRGNFEASLASHSAGIPAVLIISGRIGTIWHRNWKLGSG